jgi:hypothetical protein
VPTEPPTATEAPAWPEGDPLLPGGGRTAARIFADLFFVIPLALYGATACRGVGWLDSAMIVNNVFLLKTGSWVNTHNLFVYLARLWTVLVPIDDLAWSLNLFAGLFGAITVHLIFRAGLLLTRNLLASTVGALALMVSHSLWWHSTMLEVYTLNTALIAAMLLFVARWSRGGKIEELYKAVLCFGLGVSNHVLMGLFLFAFLALFLIPRERAALWRPGVFATGVVLFLLGSQLWLAKFEEDFVENLNRRPTWPEQTVAHEQAAATYTLYRATGGRFQESMFVEDLAPTARWRWRANYLMLVVANFPSIALPLGLLGLVSFARDRALRTPFVFFATGLAAQVAWSANYFIWDMYAFSLPVYVMFGLLVVFGADHLCRLGGRARIGLLATLPTVALTPLLYVQVAAWAQSPGYWSGYFGALGARNLWDGAEFFANPNKRSYSRTEDVLAGYAATLPEGAHLWDSDNKGYYPFHMYAQRVLGVRPDVTSHLVFGAFLDAEKALVHAQSLKRALEAGEPCFVSSAARPERTVLVQLYRLLAPGTTPQALAALPAGEFLDSFPVYRVVPVPLVGVEDAFIYRFEPR